MSLVTRVGYDRNFWYRGLQYNSTAPSLPTVSPTTTEPITVDSGTPASNVLLIDTGDKTTDLMFFAVGADNVTFLVDLYLWRKATGIGGLATFGTVLWVPTYLGQITGTASAKVGVAAAMVINTERFADTLAGTMDARVTLRSPTTDKIGDVVVDTTGYQKLGVYFGINASATSVNALFSHH